jgi:CCR4-NOT transcription complex subunit 7/8
VSDFLSLSLLTSTNREDMFAQDSIDLLKASGIDFQKFSDYGIDPTHFGELLMMSGLILTDDVKWVSFHSGYDFGYLLKVITCEDLPSDESAFLELLYTFFPSIFDIKVSHYQLTLSPLTDAPQSL